MEQALRGPTYVLVLWHDGGERLEIKKPAVLEYFRTFSDSIHEEDEYGVIAFYEDPAHRLPLRMWQQAIDIYDAYDKATGGGTTSVCPLTRENTDGKLAMLDRYELFDLYAFARALDFYDSPLLLRRVLQVIVWRLLPLSVEEIVDKHPAMPLLDFSRVGADWAITKPFLAINRAYSERLLAQDYAFDAYGLNENIIHAIHHKRPQTRQVIWAGGQFSIVLTESGLYGCGVNAYDQLGRDGGLSVHSFEHLDVKEAIISVACGQDHALINTTHGLYGVGSNMQGQLGAGTKPLEKGEPRLRRIFIGTVLPHPTVLEVACAGAYSMIRTSDGIYACGANPLGQLGVGDTQGRHLPTKVLLPCDVTVRSLSVSPMSTVFLTSDGSLYSCGLGYGIGPRTSVPTKMALTMEMGRPLKVCAGRRHCVLLTSTGLYGIGSSGSGELGAVSRRGNTTTEDWVLIRPFKREEVKSVFVGSECTFVLLVDGSLMASGNNKTGQLGITTGHGEDVFGFSKVALPSPVISMASSMAYGTGHTLFLTRDGLYGVGDNREGQLGSDPTIVDVVYTPIKISLRMGNEIK